MTCHFRKFLGQTIFPYKVASHWTGTLRELVFTLDGFTSIDLFT